ncbi:hypothetical protein Daus18300_009805 [Diaporthe australafricana]|uniref:Transcription factor domain-containing protein n=1 Tax=Diaporthe australafricana TaxID=127596 RepID=A0ABR3WCG2_9PEZI
MSLADIMEPTQSLKDLRLPEKLRIEELVAFYFAHSHTLYPVINRKEFLEVLRCIHEDPLDPLARHPLSLFRVWMVLAIGASSHCSISMVEESEPTLYYNKALEYFEAAFEYGDMPFTDVDDEFIHADGVHGHNSLEPSLMAVTRHILSLRQIASKISINVYGNRVRIRANTPDRDDIIKSLHKELIDWRRSTPFPLPDAHPRVPHLSSNWYDFNYYSHLAMLYRPSPLFPTLDSAQVKKLADAASMSIRQAYGMHRQKRIAYNWLNLLSLFTSTISLIYATTAQPQELVSHLKQTQVIDDLELALCLSEKLSSKFAAAASLRGIIGRVLGRYKEIAKGKS